MIAKGTSISNTAAALLYGDDLKKDATIIYSKHLFSESPREISKEFKMFQDQNTHCKRNTFSFILSPTIEDGKRLSDQDFSEICNSFLKELKLDDHQAIGYIHRDKAHKHAHLYVNRIDFKGKAFDSGFIGKRAQQAAKQVALNIGLVTVDQVKEKKLDATKSIRKEIKSIHDEIMKLRPKDIDDYISKMQHQGIKVIPVINKQEKLQGFRYQYKEHNFKGSEVHRDMSINKLPLFNTQESSIPKEQEASSKNNTTINQKNTLSVSSLFYYPEAEQHNNIKKKKYGKNRNNNRNISR